VVFMDEPTANLDPESSKTVRDFILELKKEKKTIFFNTHNLDEAQRVCDRIAIINTKLMAVGRPTDLEKTVQGRRTVIQVGQATDAILASLRKLPLRNLVVDGNVLTIDVTDPEMENPAIVQVLVQAGARVQSVTVAGSTLEDAYLKLVREEK